MLSAEDVQTMGPRDWKRLLNEAHPVDESDLEGMEYLGTSMGLPRTVERLTWKTFVKAFVRDEPGGVLRGWNVRLRQERGEEAYAPMARSGIPVTFGHFHAVEPAGDHGGLTLDYGLGGNAPWDLTRLVRDPLVAVNRGSSDLLLGTMALQMGPWCIPTPSFFTLERLRPVTHRALSWKERRGPDALPAFTDDSRVH